MRSCDRFGARSGLWVPTRSREERTIGFLAAHDSSLPVPASATTICGLSERSPRVPSVAVDLSQRMERDAFRNIVEERRSSSAAASRVSYTTRPGQALTSILLGLKEASEDVAGGDEARGAVARLRRASSWKPCRTCGASRSSFGRRCSMTSVSLPALERLTEYVWRADRDRC